MTQQQQVPQSGASGAHPQSSKAATTTITYGKSWADDIQKYHAAKAILPWSPEQQTPVKHVTRFEKSRQEREYDLVLGKFRDAEREIQLKHQEKDSLQSNLEHARAKQLRNVQRFNVVNHSPMYPDASDPKDRPRSRIHTASYNIISNLSSNNNPDTGANHSTPSKRPTREFNILTNKYHENHDTKAELDAAKKKEIAATKYYKTRTFDPVRITFVDEAREQQFISDRVLEQQVHGQERVSLLPPREQFAEGRLYNILNQRVINTEKLAAMSEKDRRALNKIQKSTFEAKMRVQGEEVLAKETELCLNRYAHERNSQSYVHGFDPISNELFHGRNAKATMPTRTHTALSAWQVLESGVPARSKISPQKPSIASVVSAGTTATTGSFKARDYQPGSDSSVEYQKKPNVLVVDHVPSVTTAQGSGVISTPSRTPAIRTGGFAYV